MWQTEKRICLFCGTEFIAKHHRKVYCSPECKNKANNTKEKQKREEYRKTHPKICVVCKKKFSPSHTKHKYCSYDCANKVRKEQMKMYMKKLRNIKIENTQLCYHPEYAERVNRVLGFCNNYDLIRDCPTISKIIIFKGFLTEIKEKIKSNLPIDEEKIIADYVNICNSAENNKDIRVHPFLKKIKNR